MQIKRNILLNPGPATTTDTVKLAQVVPDICPREQEFVEIMKQLRKDLVKIVHGDPERYTAVPFCGSGTINLDVCANSLLPEGKKLLVVNNGAYSARVVEICRFYRMEHIDLQFRYDELPDLNRVEAVLKENPDIAVVHTTHHETGTGLGNPIREIGALAHKYGAIFTVDTTSSYAMVPIDLARENIDFCMASAQKGIMGMTGLSFIIGRKDIIELSRTYPTRSYYCNLYLQYEFLEKTGEMHFTPPVQTIYAARQAIKEYFAEGEQAKWARHLRVHKALRQGIQELGFREALPAERQIGLVVPVRYPDDPNWDFKRVHDMCYENGFTIYPGKIASAETFRLCALGAIDVSDIQAFFVVLRQALEKAHIQIPIYYRD